MDLRQLRYFLALAEHEQFGRAAERLHITQQALSMAMSALERAVGCELLVRGRGRRVVELTAAGAALRAHAADIVARADHALSRVQAMRDGTERARLVIGLLGGGAADLNAPILGQFRADHPDIEIEVCTVDASMTRGRVGVDVVLGPAAETADPHQTVLFRDDVVLCVPLHHRLADRSHVHVSELSSDPAVRAALPATTRPAPAGRARIGLLEPDVDAALAAVAAGLAVRALATCSARYYARPDVAAVPLIGVPAVPFCVVTRAGVDDPALPVARFVAVAAQVSTRRQRGIRDTLRPLRADGPVARAG